MKVSEQIKILCVRRNISVAELARRLEMSPQNLNAKMKRETFSMSDMERIAGATGTKLRCEFVLENGETV